MDRHISPILLLIKREPCWFWAEPMKLLQRQLSDYPRWEIRVGVDTVKFDRKWPGMGLIVYSDQILDELQRNYLPPEFRNLRYEGARRTVDRDEKLA